MTTPCIQCGQTFEKKPRANASPFCSPACRNSASRRVAGRPARVHRQALTCADCGNTMRRGGGTLPQGLARCVKCRGWVGLTARPHGPCLSCGCACQGLRCRKCYAATQRVRAEGDHRVTRGRRATAAPGLSGPRRSTLLAKWKRQGRTCAYCDQLATTIDHVVPLVRGGTNYEGNLTPACKSCNSRKGGRTVIEWRAGKRLSRMTIVPDWKPAPRKPSKPRPRHVRPWREYSVCGTQCHNLTCSKSCADERSARRMRDAYRIRVGLPVNPSEPTRSLKRTPTRRLTAA